MNIYEHFVLDWTRCFCSNEVLTQPFAKFPRSLLQPPEPWGNIARSLRTGPRNRAFAFLWTAKWEHDDHPEMLSNDCRDSIYSEPLITIHNLWWYNICWSPSVHNHMYCYIHNLCMTIMIQQIRTLGQTPVTFHGAFLYPDGRMSPWPAGLPRHQETASWRFIAVSNQNTDISKYQTKADPTKD